MFARLITSNKVQNLIPLLINQLNASEVVSETLDLFVEVPNKLLKKRMKRVRLYVKRILLPKKSLGGVFFLLNLDGRICNKLIPFNCADRLVYTVCSPLLL